MFLEKLRKALLYGASFTLRPYEQIVLDAWREHLSPDGNVLLSAQVKHLVSYQRQAREMLCFFPLGKAPYPPLPAEILFPCRLDCVAAFVHLQGADSRGVRHKIRAEIHLYKGELSLIEFNQPPSKKLADGVQVAKVEIVRDPMIPASEETLSGEQRREEVLKTIHSKLPDEYLQLVGEGKGVSVNEWAVYAVQNIRKIPQRDGNYYLLAEKEGMGAVGVKEDESSGQLYYLDYGDDQGEKITVGLRKFLEEFDGGKVVGRF